MSTFMNLQMEDDPDLVMKAPYIPMNFSDDLPLLMSNDLMWNNNEKNKNHTRVPENSSTLAQMLGSSVNKRSLKGTDRGGGTVEETNVDIFNDKCKGSTKYVIHFVYVVFFFSAQFKSFIKKNLNIQ